MKKINLIFILLAILLGFFSKKAMAQTPEGINYQAIARDNVGVLMANQSITVVFTIRQGNALGSNIYRETHLITTNDLGLFNTVIGQGSANLGIFSAIDWSLGSYYLNTQLNGTDLGTTELLSVPYSLYSKGAEIADSSTNANYAHQAGIANSSNTANTANHSYVADSSTNANYAHHSGVANTANHAFIADSLNGSSLYDKLPKAMASVSSTGNFVGYNYGFSSVTRTGLGKYTIVMNTNMNNPIITLGLVGSSSNSNESARINYSISGNQILIQIYDRYLYTYSSADYEYVKHILADGNFSIVVHGK